MTRVVRFFNTAPIAETVQALELAKDAVRARRALQVERVEKIKAGRKAAAATKNKGGKKKRPIALPENTGSAAPAPPRPAGGKRKRVGAAEVTAGALPAQE